MQIWPVFPGPVTFEEKDLGVIIDKDLKFHVQTAAVINKANRLLGLIKKCFVNISIESFIILYKSLVRPCLEYGNVIWGPFYMSDRIRLEKESHQDGHSHKSFELLWKIKISKFTIFAIQKIQRRHIISSIM